MAGIRIIIDRNRCIGSGRCVEVAPEVFSQDEDDGIVILLQERPTEEQREAAEAAVWQCPSMAIRAEED